MILRKTFRFEASHLLPRHNGKCRRLHGHSWVLHVFVDGTINKETGFVMDYALISEQVKPLIEKLDHRHLGAWPSTNLETHLGFEGDFSIWSVEGLPEDFYPSSENLLVWIGKKLISLEWSKLALEETCTSYCELTRKELLEKY